MWTQEPRQAAPHARFRQNCPRVLINDLTVLYEAMSERQIQFSQWLALQGLLSDGKKCFKRAERCPNSLKSVPGVHADKEVKYLLQNFIRVLTIPATDIPESPPRPTEAMVFVRSKSHLSPPPSLLLPRDSGLTRQLDYNWTRLPSPTNLPAGEFEHEGQPLKREKGKEREDRHAHHGPVGTLECWGP